MPIHRPDTVTRVEGDGKDNPCGPFSALKFSDDGDLTQFGAFVEILPPGSKSSIKHWHANEDEMVYVLEGQVTLHEGNILSSLGPGDAATFKAGADAGHCLENKSNEAVSFLVIGTRAASEVVTYPDDDRQLAFDRRDKTRVWTDHAGNPASNPYKLA
ncbi:MAG: cupin domain-containing protein [Boseongicola sp.]